MSIEKLLVNKNTGNFEEIQKVRTLLHVHVLLCEYEPRWSNDHSGFCIIRIALLGYLI